MKTKALRQHQQEKNPEAANAAWTARMAASRTSGLQQRQKSHARRLRHRILFGEEKGPTCGINSRDRSSGPVTFKRRKIKTRERKITLEKAIVEIRSWIKNQEGSITAEEIRVKLELPIGQIRTVLHKLNLEGLVGQAQRQSPIQSFGFEVWWQAKRYHINTPQPA
jgi:hypothetical protein